MSNIALDLNVLVNETWDLTLVGGDTLRVKKPYQKLAIELLTIHDNPVLKGKIKTENVSKIIGFYADMVRDIFNNNTDDRVFTRDEINRAYPLDLQQVIVAEYTKFMNGLLSDPN